MTVTERPIGNVTIIDVSGNVTLTDGADQVRDKVRSLMQQGQKHVLVNLAKVSYMDSAGLGELVTCMTTVRNQGGQFRLCTATKQVKDALHITRLASVLDLWADEPAALNSLAAQGKKGTSAA